MVTRTFAHEYWTRTNAELTERRSPIPTPSYLAKPGDATPIVIDPSRPRQAWTGAGAAITDATACLIRTSMDAEQRHALLADLFDPNEGAGLSVIRLPLGSCDFNKQEYYTYDDLPYGEHDASLSRFSIGEGTPGSPEATKDMKYIVPVVQEILTINPGVKILASPWSAPAWMKTSGHLTHGGRLRFNEWTGNGFDPQRDSFEGVYARYFVKYIDAMASYGIPIHYLTIQNEPGNAAPWPAMIWTPQELAQFGHSYLRPALDASHPDVEILFHDDNLMSITRPLNEYMTAEQASAFSGCAIHTYEMPLDNIRFVERAFPHWTMAMSERRCMMLQTPQDASHIMFGINCNWMIQHGMSLLTLWNLALDERGVPNMAGSFGRRGVITIDHTTGKVKRNLEYYMLRNLGQNIEPGSHVIASTNLTRDGISGGPGSSAFLGPDRAITAILYNPEGHDIDVAVTVNGQGARWQRVTIPAWGTVTLHKSEFPANESQAPADDEFELHPISAHFAGDPIPGKE